MKSYKVAFIATIVSFCLLLGIRQKNKDWRNTFKQDLTAIYNTLKENHPGFYDDQNSAFKEWLNDGYHQALNKFDHITSLADYIYGLRLFVNGFKDAHLRIQFDKSLLSAEWPSFCIGYQKGKFIVVHSEKDNIPLGAELILCDGEFPSAWLEKNVLPYIDARHIEASLFVTAPYVTVWEGASFVARPKKYIFQIGTETHEVDPVWEKISITDYFSKLPKKKLQQRAFIRELGANQVWISIPSFYPQTPEEEDTLNNLISAISHYATYDLIVFDMRGNGGGNSHYGTTLLKNLYGERYCNALLKRLHDKKYVEWRASTGNIDYMKELIVKLEKQFGQSEIVSVFSDIHEGMQKNKSDGNAFYKRMNSSKESNDSYVITKSLNARIFVITDHYCASACLDFLDELFTLDSVIHIGIATNVDTNYMECRDVKLPSSLVTLHFPIKVFRNRIRKANESYAPQYHVDDIYNDNLLEEVIQKIILQ